MLITPNSPLKRVPATLDRKQQLSLEGIRFSVEMIDIAFNRLKAILRSISNTKKEIPKDNQPAHDVFGACLLDSWSIIDSVHRLRTLVQKMRGLKRTQPIENFLENSKSVISFRNRFHHLNEDIGKGLYLNKPVLGSVSWVTYVDSEIPTLRIFVLAPGTITPEIGHLVNPCGEPVKPPVDLISLDAHGERLSLSQQHHHIEQLVKSLETAVHTAAGDLPQASGDLLISADIEFEADSNYVEYINNLRKHRLV